jgi:O-antigen/teichoic acid export membrane protein
MVSSAGNFVFVAVVARTATVEDFGAFSLTYALYAIALGAGRAIGGDILLLRAVQRPQEARAESERLLLLVAAIGALAGAGIFGVTLVLDTTLGATMRALAICLPILLLQDAIRYCFFARAEPGRAMLNDSVWFVGQTISFAALLVLAPDAGPGLFIFGWASGAGVAVAIGLRHTRLVPRLSRQVSRARLDRTRARSFLIDFVLSAASLNLAFYAIAGVAGLAAAGAVRGAMLLFAPLSSVVSGMRIIVLPALARAVFGGRQHLRATASRFTLAFATLALAYSLVVMPLPDSLGRLMLGETWDAAQPLLLAIAIMYSAWTIGTPALAGLRALGGGRILVQIRTGSAALYFGCIVAGAAMGEAVGAATGMAVAFGIEAALWWIGFLRTSRFGGGRMPTRANPLAEGPTGPALARRTHEDNA